VKTGDAMVGETEAFSPNLAVGPLVGAPLARPKVVDGERQRYRENEVQCQKCGDHGSLP